MRSQTLTHAGLRRGALAQTDAVHPDGRRSGRMIALGPAAWPSLTFATLVGQRAARPAAGRCAWCCSPTSSTRWSSRPSSRAGWSRCSARAAQAVGRLAAAPAAGAASSRVVALMPTLLVAVFATITLNFGLEGWFSDRVRNVVANSLAAAQAYEDEHRRTLQTDAAVLARFLDGQKARYPLLTGGDLRELLTRGQAQMQRALPKAYVIDGDGELRARGERSYLVRLRRRRRPRTSTAADAGEVVVIEDWANNEFRALLRLARLRRPFPLRQPRGRRQDPEPARRDPGDGAALPAARGRPRAAAVRVRADLSRLRARRDPRRDLDGAVVRRAAVAAGRAGWPPRRARRARATSTCGCSRRTATTRSRCWAARSTR